MLRAVFPAAAGGIVALGMLRWLGEYWGLYPSVVGIAFMTVAMIGVIGGLLWVFARRLDRDEADRLQIDAQLLQSSRYFDLSRDLLCTSGFDGIFRQLNPAWSETLGWSEAELRSRPFVEFVHPDDRARTVLETAGLASGHVTVDFVNRYEAKDGGWRWIDWRASANLDDELIYASARDVTERKKAEAAAQVSARQTRQILESAHDAFIALDASGTITEWNPRAAAIFGWSADEVLGRDLAGVLIPEARRDAHHRGMQRFLATGESQVLGRLLELTVLHRDGYEFLVELTISALETEDGYCFNAFLRDITARKKAQLELALARDEALEASRMKSMFVANVSHEIRTPMNGVIGMTDLLLETDLDSEQREFAETIASSGEALLDVIDDILDLSKIEAGKLELDPTDFDLREAIERACGMLAARAHAKGLELVVAIDLDVPARVRGDVGRVRQVVANLVSNAIKFTSSGEVVVRASSSVRGDRAPLVRVEVADTGIGIEPAALGKLFKPFTQADSSTTRKYGGTGLGLAISRQLIEMMGGTVGADSVVGSGSRFWLQLPLAIAASGPSASRDERDLTGVRALVVDDNATNRMIVQRQLGSWMMLCDVADGATQALAMLESARAAGRPYALALLDLNMPGMDGYGLASAIRSQHALRGIRLVLLTSSGSRADGLDAAALDGSVSKPVRPSRLREEIEDVLSGDRPAPRRDRRTSGAVATGNALVPGPEVLIVEDTAVNQIVAAHMLEKCGFRSRIAENGRVALEALSQRSYAVVLMDCQMPELDGYETTREIRARERGGAHVPIIAMTANSMKGERERCLAAGMDDYLTKPLRSRTLMDALSRWVPADAAPDAATLGDYAPPPEGDAQLLREAVVAELETLDRAVLAGLHSQYLDEAAGQLSALRADVAQGDEAAVARTAHALKGTSATIGAALVAQIASELEAGAKAGDLNGAGELLERLLDALARTRTALDARDADRAPLPAPGAPA